MSSGSPWPPATPGGRTIVARDFESLVARLPMVRAVLFLPARTTGRPGLADMSPDSASGVLIGPSGARSLQQWWRP